MILGTLCSKYVILAKSYFPQIGNGVSSKAQVIVWSSLLGLPFSPRLASLVGTGAGAGAYTPLSAFSTGGTSGTSVSPGTLLTRLVMPLLTLADDRRVIYGFTSKFRLMASLGARLGYWRYSWSSFDRCLSGTGALRSAFSAGDVSALSGTSPTSVVPDSLACDPLSLEALPISY